MRHLTLSTLLCLCTLTLAIHAKDASEAKAKAKVNAGPTPQAKVKFVHPSFNPDLRQPPIGEHWQPDVAWEAMAPARIQRFRMGTFHLLLKFLNGSAVENGQRLSLTLKKHDFLFGTVFNPAKIDEEDREWYYATVRKHFNALVPEVAFRWPIYEPTEGTVNGTMKQLLEEVFQWSEENGISHVRGHYIEWPLKGKGKFWPHMLDCKGYKAAMKKRIQRDMPAYRGKFQSYDIINEPLMRRDMFDRCNFWNDSTWQDIHRWAHEADPAAQLCLNENLLSAGGTAYSRIGAFVKTAQEMLAEKVPIHCLGVQSYSNPFTLPSGGLRESLDRMGATGLPVYITEFGIASRWIENTKTSKDNFFWYFGSEEQHARWMLNMLTWYFSHPAVKGIWLWDFWQGHMWLKNSGMYNPDKSPKQSASVVERLWSVMWNSSALWTSTTTRARPLQRSGTALKATIAPYNVKTKGEALTATVGSVSGKAFKATMQTSLLTDSASGRPLEGSEGFEEGKLAQLASTSLGLGAEVGQGGPRRLSSFTQGDDTKQAPSSGGALPGVGKRPRKAGVGESLRNSSDPRVGLPRSIVTLASLAAAALPVTRITRSVVPGGPFSFRGFYGTYDLHLTLSNGQFVEGEVSFPSAAGRTQTVEVILYVPDSW